ncbi:aspartyl protease family protein [bacterium]|nr:aspartyl protease family protein [bacterium]
MNKRLIFIIILILLPIIAQSSPSRQKTETEKILEKHLKALGGERAIRSFKSYICSSEIKIMPTGMNGTIKQWSLKPCLYRSEVSLGLFAITQGYDGETSWMIDQNGKVIYNRDISSRKKQITTCIIDDYKYLFEEEGIALRFSGTDTSSNGRLCDILSLTPIDGYPCKIYLDKETYLTEQIIIETENGYVEQDYGDYRPVNKMMLPFETSVRNPAINQTIKTTITSIDVNPVIPISVFIPPRVSADDYSFIKGNSSKDVPFLYSGEHIYLPVQLGTQKKNYTFLLDSGAGITVIDSTLAANLGFPIGDKITGAGIGGTTYCYMTRIPGFKVEGIEFNAQTIIALPLGDITTRFSNIETSGILGYDFLSRFITEINYEDKTISFFEPDSFKYTGTGQIMDAPLIHKVFSTKCILDGEFDGTFLIDTGANNSLLLHSFAERNNLFSGRKLASVSVVGAGGEKEVHLSRFKSLNIAGATMLNPILFIAGQESGLASFEGVSGVIGNDILERFKIIMNYSDQQIIMERNSSYSKPFLSDKSGLQTTRDSSGYLYVHYVIPGSPANEKGLKSGDRIISINGKKMSEFENLAEATRLFKQEEGTQFKLLVERGKEKIRVIIKLRAYF